MLSHDQSVSFWQDPKKRGYLYQFLALLVVGGIVFGLYSNTVANLEKQNIASGFSFLDREAGFEISESVIEYWSDESYTKALWVGVLNTLKVAFWGNILAVFLGILIGIARLSPNWLLAKMAHVYVESLRNVPLLLQLFFWYAFFTELLPGVKKAYQLIPNVYLSNRGLVFPTPVENPVWTYSFVAFIVALLLVFIARIFFKRLKEKRGEGVKGWPYYWGIILGLPVTVWLVGGAPWDWEIPQLSSFNFSGGYTLTPEFVSLMLGLVLYTAAFNAEIVRAGILAVRKGQWEAAQSLGLTRTQVMGLVVLPQALRVIIPPMTSQILNLTKNSSLAVGIGYPDFVSVANTTMNQTGQAIEAVLLIMGVYLVFSLSTSLLMNFYNKSVALKER